MLCPSCGHDNLPGADSCAECQTSLMQEDVPVALIRTRIEQSLSEDTIDALRPSAAVSVAEDTPLDAAVGIMREKRIGCLLITDAGGKLSGILTERDLLNKVAGQVDDLTRHAVREFMVPRPETVQANQLLAVALQRMKVGDHRHLPLVDEEGHPKQVISSRDIINYLASLVEGIV